MRDVDLVGCMEMSWECLQLFFRMSLKEIVKSKRMHHGLTPGDWISQNLKKILEESFKIGRI